MPASQRRPLWRSTVEGMWRHGWLPVWQEEGGKCVTRFIIGGPVTGTWHLGNGMEGAFYCSSCRRVILRGEGRWWD